jgi:hypothetical protein
MKKALISPNELIYSYDGTLIGVRVADVVAQEFDVAQPLYWFECDDEVNAQYWYFQTETNSCQLIPVAPN